MRDPHAQTHFIKDVHQWILSAWDKPPPLPDGCSELLQARHLCSGYFRIRESLVERVVRYLKLLLDACGQREGFSVEGERSILLPDCRVTHQDSTWVEGDAGAWPDTDSVYGEGQLSAVVTEASALNMIGRVA